MDNTEKRIKDLFHSETYVKIVLSNCMVVRGVVDYIDVGFFEVDGIIVEYNEVKRILK